MHVLLDGGQKSLDLMTSCRGVVNQMTQMLGSIWNYVPIAVPHDLEQNDQTKSKPVPPFLPPGLEERSWNRQTALPYTKGDGKGDTMPQNPVPSK